MDGIELEQRVGVAAVRRQLVIGANLFRQGDSTVGLFLLIDGQVRLVRHGRDGGTVALHVVRPLETFAEASLFSAVYHCDAVADCPSTVSLLPKAAILDLIAHDNAFAIGFATRLARQVQTLRTQVELRNIRSAEERVLAALSLRAPLVGQDIEVAVSLKAFASEIGLTHEALYRALRRLEQRGMIQRAGRVLRVLPQHRGGNHLNLSPA